MTAHERVLNALTEHGCRGRGTSWQCPAHEDSAPSLSITRGKKGAVLNCHAGCAPEDVVTALGLTMKDLFDEPMERHQPQERPRVVATYRYVDEHGELLILTKRFEPGFDGKKKSFAYYKPDGTKGIQGIRRVLYRLPEVVAAAQSGGLVFVVEGEKDADNLAKTGAVATCNLMGAGSWNDGYTASLRGVGEVIVIADRDDPGRKHAAQVADSVHRAGIPVRVLQPAKGKDVSDHLAAGLGYDDLMPLDDGQAAEPEQKEAAQTGPGHLPEEFWNARPILKHIRKAAHSKAAPADVVLYSFLARVSGMLPHLIRAETGIGSRASLNIFAASVGNSGTGKSTSKDCVRDLMPPPDEDFRDGLPIGTGEGIAETFMGTVEEPTGELHQKGPYKGDPVMHRVRKQVRHNAFFYVDEGQTLARIGERTGSTLAETLRRAAVGETLGQTNATEERTRYIPAGSYSMGLLIGLQPSIATVLLSDTATGTPQRFWWAWAIDATIPYEPVKWPGQLDVPVVRKRLQDPVDVTFPAAIREQLRRERVARGRGELEVPELDGHAGLMKVKMSALLALLDGREAVTEDDWALAEVMWRCSCAVRDALVVRAQREAAAERQRAEDDKVRAELRAHLAKTDADRSLERVAGLVRKHASQVGGITFGYLRRALAGRDRPLLEKAIDLAESREWVVVEGDRVCVKTD